MRAPAAYPLASLQEKDPSGPPRPASPLLLPVLLRALDTGPPSHFLMRPSDLFLHRPYLLVLLSSSLMSRILEEAVNSVMCGDSFFYREAEPLARGN